MQKIIYLISCLSIFTLIGFTQVKTDSATEEFDEYERNFKERTSTPTPTRKLPGNSKINGRTPTPTPKPTATPIKSIGKPGMKIWLERQTKCAGDFRLVAPTAVFQSVDCIRMRFRLNFDGYLTIINAGTSGKNKPIFPLKNQSNRIFASIDNYLPDNGGWEFVGEPGDEQIVFIVSKLPLSKSAADDYDRSRDFVAEDSPDIEIYDRDIVPRTENDEVYILTEDTELEKPLVFRMTVKHR